MKSLIVFFIFLTSAILVAGIIVMFIGGKTNKKYSNKLMLARVIAQGSAVILLILLSFAMSSNG